MSAELPKVTLPAIIYCRVSDAKQVTRGDGLNSQQARCAEYCERKGYSVVGVFRDDVTGSTVERAGLQSMLTFMKKHRGPLVLAIDDLSRLGRDKDVYWSLRRAIKKSGAVLESPSFQFGDDADSVFFESIMVNAAEYQRLKNAEQTMNRMRARMMNGYACFQPPVGYRYQAVAGRGKMLVPDEPAASVVREAIEGYASGRFDTQADVMRFLQKNPLFPKDASGIVQNQRVSLLLNQPLYAGYIVNPKWGISLRPAQHEAIISFQTYKRVQDRLRGGFYAPRQKNLSDDFILRGYVECADCGSPLTACWAKGSHAKFPYYHCVKRGCASHGKSIRRAVIEGEFEELLQSITPTEMLFDIARKMLKKLWDHQEAQGQHRVAALQVELKKIERQVATLLDRVVDASTPSVITAYENRIRLFEEEKLEICERLSLTKRPARDYDTTVRTALAFLASPWNLWNSGCSEARKTVLKLAFTSRLQYRRGEGFRTTDKAFLALPFKMLANIENGKSEMARPKRFELLTF